MSMKKRLSSSTCRRHVVPMHMRILRGILPHLAMCEHCKCERHNMATFPTCRSSISRSSRAFFGRRSSLSSASALAIRISLVGAFCIGSLGLAFKTPFVRSHPLLPLLRSKFTSQSSAESIHSTGMEGNSNTVPSIVVYVTVPNKEAGKKLAESIIKEKLAACVNRVPGIESMYFWEGKIQTDSEELLIIKTRESLLKALTEHVKSNHEYEVPEVISMPITGGNLKYLEWIKNSTRD